VRMGGLPEEASQDSGRSAKSQAVGASAVQHPERSPQNLLNRSGVDCAHQRVLRIIVHLCSIHPYKVHRTMEMQTIVPTSTIICFKTTPHVAASRRKGEDPIPFPFLSFPSLPHAAAVALASASSSNPRSILAWLSGRQTPAQQAS
jgi:hypothetical protein